MENSLQLDPLNPPRHCPQCALSGVKSKVKKFKMNTSEETEVVIMCKNDQCPWPFSVLSKAEATLKTEIADLTDSSSVASASSPSQSTSRKRKRGKLVKDESGFEENLSLNTPEKPFAVVNVSKDVIVDKGINVEANDSLIEINENKEEFENATARVSPLNASIHDENDYSNAMDIREDPVVTEVGTQPALQIYPPPDVKYNMDEATVTVSRIEDQCGGQYSQTAVSSSSPLQNQDLFSQVLHIDLAPYTSPGSKVHSPVSLSAKSLQGINPLVHDGDGSCPAVKFLHPAMEITSTLAMLATTALQSGGDDTQKSLGRRARARKRKASAGSPPVLKLKKKKITPPKTNCRFSYVESVKGLEQPVNVLTEKDLEEPSEKDLEERRRIESLIKPPYPRRRRVRKVLIQPRSRNTHARPKRDCKTSIKLKSTIVPTSKDLKEDVSVLQDNSSDLFEKVSEDLLLKVTKALEYQNQTLVRSKVEINGCSSIPNHRRGEFDVNTCSEDAAPDAESILILKPKNTYARSKKNKLLKFQPSSFPETIDDVEITLEETVDDENNVNLREVSYMFQVGELESGSGEKQQNLDDARVYKYSETRSWKIDNSGLGRIRTDNAARDAVEENDDSWFWWRGWMINEQFMKDFINSMKKLVVKWTPTKNKVVDSRIFALTKEWEEKKESPEKVEKVISFFSEVFVKFVYMKSEFPNYGFKKLLRMLKMFHGFNSAQLKKKLQVIKSKEEGFQEEITETQSKSNQVVEMGCLEQTEESVPGLPSPPPSAHNTVLTIPHNSVEAVDLSSKSSTLSAAATTYVIATNKDYQCGGHEVQVDKQVVEFDQGEDKGTIRKGPGEISGTVRSDCVEDDLDNGNSSEGPKIFGGEVESSDSMFLAKAGKETPERSYAREKKRGGVGGMNAIKKGIKEKRSYNKYKLFPGGDKGVLDKLLDISMKKSAESSVVTNVNPVAPKTADRRKSKAPAQIKTDERVAPVIASSSHDDKPGGGVPQNFPGFTQAYARKNKKQAEKINKVLEKQKRIAEGGPKRKYAGFCESLDPADKVEKKKRKVVKTEVTGKISKVSQSELDLIEELLNIDRTNENEFTPAEAFDLDISKNPIETETSVIQFNEFQTLVDNQHEPVENLGDFECLFDF